MKQIKFISWVLLLVCLSIGCASCGSFGEGFLAGMGGYSPGYSSYGGYNAYAAGSMPGANASMQEVHNWAMANAIQQTNAQNFQMQQVSNWAMNNAIQQTNAQEEEEYQQYLRATGSNISKDEWRIKVGEALMESNSSASKSSSSSSSSTRSSSTSSSSNKRKKCVPSVWLGSQDHRYCYGTGKCDNCNGRGYITSFGNTVKCTYCHTTGKCQMCNGTGYLD
ncbi:MAG: hypothetical protein LIP09_05810 [Bacteroidales bacterium]|nr:hypothetical protein [Bacteroidales bacterium]